MILPPTCTRRIQFCAGHRVYGHENKCANPHGHNYVAYLTARAVSLDRVGRVVDFSVLKARVGGWIDSWWDHAFIFSAKDGELAALFDAHPEWKAYCLPFNPTAENMARYLLETVGPETLGADDSRLVELVRVRLYETENCYADAALDV